MLAGTVVSAVMGGLAGLAFALAQNHEALQLFLFYQIGGLLAVLAFITRAVSFQTWRDDLPTD